MGKMRFSSRCKWFSENKREIQQGFSIRKTSCSSNSWRNLNKCTREWRARVLDPLQPFHLSIPNPLTDFVTGTFLIFRYNSYIGMPLYEFFIFNSSIHFGMPKMLPHLYRLRNFWICFEEFYVHFVARSKLRYDFEWLIRGDLWICGIWWREICRCWVKWCSKMRYWILRG